MNIKELYQEIILEHGKNPRNLRKTDNFNKDAKGYNPLCGDNVHVYLKLNEQKKVEDASFEGSGCAISMASASIMTDLVKGKEENEVKEIILEHGKNPRNLRKTDNFNKDAKGYNPLCGDHVHVYLKLNEKKKVEDASFEGSGCAISMASASIMTDLVKGKEENEVKEIIKDFLVMIKENPELKSKNLKEEEKTRLMCLSGVKQYPMRVKCATLSWHTLISAIDNTQEEINTERLD